MEDIPIKENERIDDLQYKDLKIIQETDGFCFGIDSILISDFAKNIKKNADGSISNVICNSAKLLI